MMHLTVQQVTEECLRIRNDERERTLKKVRSAVKEIKRQKGDPLLQYEFIRGFDLALDAVYEALGIEDDGA